MNITPYLMAEFEHGAYGPDKFDCFGLVWHVNLHHNNTELPRFDDVGHQLQRMNAAIMGEQASEDWQEVDVPKQFDVVVMRRSGEAHHVGVWLDIDGGKVLHACEKGIFCQSISALGRNFFQHIQYYRYAGN